MLTITEDPGSGITTQLIIILILIIINAFFASSELAILSANPNRINILADKGNQRAKLVQRLQADETKFLSTIQVGITLAGFFSSATAAVSLSEGFAETLNKLNLPFANEIALIIVTLILSYFTLVFGELFPKRIALRSPEKIAMFVAKPINGIRIIFKPIVFLLSGSCELLVRLFRLKKDSDDKITEEEVKALVSTAVDHGTIDEDKKELIEAVFIFDDLSVKDVMTPRVDIVMIDIKDGVSKILKKIREEKYTRIPVYDGSVDNIIGILNIKDIVLILGNKNISIDGIKSILRKPYYVSESMKADSLFKNLQTSQEQSALVIDESGSLSGYVAMEDLIEEVMGNIYDEYDDIITNIKKCDDDSYIIDGSTSIQEINRELDLELKKNSEYNSIAGLITYNLKKVPTINDTITVENLTFKVVETKNNRVLKVQLYFNE